ncbi:MAG TPA: hypothetical protein VFV47_13050 [Hyphomicrobiaceae bacterium]|nr:hypothetical protein [Hyphomicrobiaceae bacterium]
MTSLTNIVRSKGDPKVLQTGTSSLGPADRLTRALGWFSIGLGLTQLLSPRSVTRRLGMRGAEPMTRLCGAREITSGLLALSIDRKLGLWSRLAGDAFDIAALVPATSRYNPRRGNAKLALAAVVGITALDAIAAIGTRSAHRRTQGQKRSYGDRSGFPRGLEATRRSVEDRRTLRATVSGGEQDVSQSRH